MARFTYENDDNGMTIELDIDATATEYDGLEGITLDVLSATIEINGENVPLVMTPALKAALESDLEGYYDKHNDELVDTFYSYSPEYM